MPPVTPPSALTLRFSSHEQEAERIEENRRQREAYDREVEEQLRREAEGIRDDDYGDDDDVAPDDDYGPGYQPPANAAAQVRHVAHRLRWLEYMRTQGLT